MASSRKSAATLLPRSESPDVAFMRALESGADVEGLLDGAVVVGVGNPDEILKGIRIAIGIHEHRNAVLESLRPDPGQLEGAQVPGEAQPVGPPAIPQHVVAPIPAVELAEAKT